LLASRRSADRLTISEPHRFIELEINSWLVAKLIIARWGFEKVVFNIFFKRSVIEKQAPLLSIMLAFATWELTIFHQLDLFIIPK